MYNIRNYELSDYPMVHSWWTTHKEQAPMEDQIPEDTSFILEDGTTPIYCLSFIATNTPILSYLENFVVNPNFPKEKRKEASQTIVNCVLSYAKALGYKHVLCFASNNKLKQRYKELGMTPTLDNVQAFVKVI